MAYLRGSLLTVGSLGPELEKLEKDLEYDEYKRKGREVGEETGGGREGGERGRREREGGREER